MDWDSVYKNRFCKETNPKWEKHIHPISSDGTGLLGVDDDNNLYWDGKQIEIKKRVILSVWQNIGTVIVVIATAIMAFTAIYDSFFKPLCE